MNVLIACEESQRVCAAFLNRGHNAFSCDILPPSGGMHDRHIQGDVIPLINGCCDFETMNGDKHNISTPWDLIIAHPPCTYLSNAGARHLYPGGQLNKERYEKGKRAKWFFMQFLLSTAVRVCVENPIPSRIYELIPYTQIIQPYEFGDPYTKRTCLWLRNLPRLTPTNIVTPKDTFCPSSKHVPGHGRGQHTTDRQRERSKTFRGIALAMAEQWG